VPLRVALRAAILALPLAACATVPIAAGIPRTVDHLVIAPYATHAECMHLVPGDRVDWRYESSAPIHFDIAYREGNAVMAPVVRDDSTTDSGTFEARLAEDYCLTWEAGPPGAIIGYRLLLRHPASP
jgi:hypothetical protein